MYPHVRDTVYHGTIHEITSIDVTYGRDKKDFGKGFYMSVSKAQAIGMMQKKYREAVRRGGNRKADGFHELLYEIKLNKDALDGLKVKEFSTADKEWLDFVLTCREQGGLPHDYDFVTGPTADDDTLLCLKAYWDGLYGRPGSDDAKNILLRNLEPENLGTQYFIGKQHVADTLITSIRKVER